MIRGKMMSYFMLRVICVSALPLYALYDTIFDEKKQKIFRKNLKNFYFIIYFQIVLKIIKI